MKELQTGRSMRMAFASDASTWRTAAKRKRPSVRVPVGHLEKDQQLRFALDEYCELREQDESLSATHFCDRYPSYRHSLMRLIAVHEAISALPALDEGNWPEVGTEFLGYQIIRELGVGAIARVYLAIQPELGGRLVALKVSHGQGDEAETLGKLSHANIVPVHSVAYDRQSELTVVCMPYQGSATLADLLDLAFESNQLSGSANIILQAGRRREEFVAPKSHDQKVRAVHPVLMRGSYVDGVALLGQQIAEALAYTHERGILHRDLKPSNVLLTPDGIPKLLDFNLASDIAVETHRVGGTLPYMPPEQIREVHLRSSEANWKGDPRSDIFSFGVVLYELLTGQLPFGDPPAGLAPRNAAEVYLAAQQKALRSAQHLNPAISSELAQLLHKCLAFEPSQRPAAAADLVRELKKYFTPRRRVQRWISRHRIAVATLTLVLILIGAPAISHLAARAPFEDRGYAAGVAKIMRNESIEHFDGAIEGSGQYFSSEDFEIVDFRIEHDLVGESLLISGRVKNGEAVEGKIIHFDGVFRGHSAFINSDGTFTHSVKISEICREFRVTSGT